MEKDKMILGKDAVFSTDCNETGLNNNVLICGSSGCGKTMSVIEPRLLETYDSNLIVTVTKRRIVKKYTPVLRERGYQVLDLNLLNPENSNIIFDPLQYVKNYQDARCLAESIVYADPRKNRSNADPYWDQASTSLLSAEIGYVLKTRKSPTFADVLEFHDSLMIYEKGPRELISTSLDSNFETLEKMDPKFYAVTCWKVFQKLPARTASCILSALNVSLDSMFSPELRNAMVRKRKLNFRKMAEQKTVLFVSTSAVNPSLHSFVNMFYTQAFKQLFEYAQKDRYGRLPIPVHIMCDDFATGGRILNFPEYISIFREAQISVTMLLQSESQLQSMYSPEDAVTIINNCDTYVYMGGMDIMTARNVSTRLNVPLEDVLYMPVSQEIIFRRGQKPVVTQRYKIFEDERYRTITTEYEKMDGIII